MPINRLALIRYKTIDNCLRNKYRKWTIENLVDACSDALYEFEGKLQGVSLRTIQLDIQNMRSEKLGYNAPIVVVEKKYYTYSDADFSITNMPLTSADVNTLSQITHTLKQFEGFSQFSDMEEVLKKIENKVFAINNQARTIIDFEKNNNLKGIKFLNEIYDAIKNKTCLKIVYQSFNTTKPTVIYLSPYLLKEYRNRWFVFGKRKHSNKISPLALDRILRLPDPKGELFVENTIFDSENYFNDIIGVTRYEKMEVAKIVFWVEKSNAPYVITKPFHSSQQIIETKEDGTIFSINVIPNFEMERELIGFGEFLKVIEPIDLMERFKLRVNKMKDLYK
ncbi:MAG: WYL domain-containing protein [Bacteroidetes bacterium GWA2_30_7]|nr:MAG: WYL domain-containing protein [Bacteroidetes bacterium GWA2_30_7]